MSAKPAVSILANSIISGKSMSGGDKIFIEWARRWQANGNKVTLLLCSEGYELRDRSKLDCQYSIISRARIGHLGPVFAYILRIIEALISLRKRTATPIVYSSSDFLTDVIPCLFLKLTNPRITFSSAFFLISPNPFAGETRATLESISYFVSQRISRIILKRYADLVFALNSLDARYLVEDGFPPDMVKVVSGGVDSKLISSVQKTNVRYAACFVGRLHQEKGIEDLIEIWDLVCKQKGGANMAIIGWGSNLATQRLQHEIAKRSLSQNIHFCGFLDGVKKIEILKSSQVFVFPSHRESWSVAVCEAMASGLPVIAYDLPVYKEIYNGGMVRVAVGDRQAAANAILELLSDSRLYLNLKMQALATALRYDWDNTAMTALAYLADSAANDATG